MANFNLSQYVAASGSVLIDGSAPSIHIGIDGYSCPDGLTVSISGSGSTWYLNYSGTPTQSGTFYVKYYKDLSETIGTVPVSVAPVPMLVGLQGWWILGDNGSGALSLTDSNGNANPLSNSGGVTLSSGGATWGSGADTLVAPQTFSFVGGLSLSARVKFTSDGGYRVIAQEWDGGTGWVFFFGFTPAGNLVSAVTANTSGPDSGAFVGNGAWRQVGMTYDPYSGTLIQYVDGRPALTTVYGRDHALAGSSRNFTVGSDASQGVGGFRGQITQLGVWDRVLSPSEMLELSYRGTNGFPFVQSTGFDLSNSGSEFLF